MTVVISPAKTSDIPAITGLYAHAYLAAKAIN
jgi:L-amino acid N-acyltransferase YncA